MFSAKVKYFGKPSHILVVSFIIFLFPEILFSQNLSDTLQIKEVKIIGSKIVAKEESGQTSSRIDFYPWQIP